MDAWFTEFIHLKNPRGNLNEPLDSSQFDLRFFLRSDPQVQNCDFFAYGNGRSREKSQGKELLWGTGEHQDLQPSFKPSCLPRSNSPSVLTAWSSEQPTFISLYSLSTASQSICLFGKKTWTWECFLGYAFNKHSLPSEHGSKNKKAEGLYYLAKIRWSKRLIHEPSISSYFCPPSINKNQKNTTLV